MSQTHKNWKRTLSRIIYQTDTPAGYLFDVLLILSILLNSILIIVESVENIRVAYGGLLLGMQYFFVAVFTVEYILRILVVENKRTYITSFFGVIDLLAIVPFYVAFVFPFARLFPVLRTLRLLRMFAVFKMVRYVEESGTLMRALRASRQKITIFLITILFIIVIVGALMYTVEGPEHGFINIPESMYWAVVTVSTVGYGDISPQTGLGKLLASFLMITGYGIIAVPTGIITSEMAFISQEKSVIGKKSVRKCDSCGSAVLSDDSAYCHRCGNELSVQREKTGK